MHAPLLLEQRNGQAHISLTIPSAGFRGGDQAFDILPLSVGQVGRSFGLMYPIRCPMLMARRS